MASKDGWQANYKGMAEISTRLWENHHTIFVTVDDLAKYVNRVLDHLLKYGVPTLVLTSLETRSKYGVAIPLSTTGFFFHGKSNK